MLYIIQNPEKFPVEMLRRLYLAQVKFSLLNLNRGPNEIKMDEYLKKTYNFGLKEACFKIYDNVVVSISSPMEACVVLQDRELEKLAGLITYGNTQVQGSTVLKIAFGSYNL